MSYAPVQTGISRARWTSSIASIPMTQLRQQSAMSVSSPLRIDS